VPPRSTAPAALRIVAGSLKGRRLSSPTWTGLRPTSDRLRETLFNILGEACRDASVLDAFAGTGAVGIEALSRGAAHVMFVDHDPRAIALIHQNLARCGVMDRYTIQRMDLARSGPAFAKATAGKPAFPTAFDLIFLDPPYEMTPTDACGALALSLANGGLLVLEHARRMNVPDTVADLRRTRIVTSGDSALSFFRRTRTEPEVNEAA
jgi:16S rRNA (guanine966-N2)-methyltransferase